MRMLTYRSLTPCTLNYHEHFFLKFYPILSEHYKSSSNNFLYNKMSTRLIIKTKQLPDFFAFSPEIAPSPLNPKVQGSNAGQTFFFRMYAIFKFFFRLQSFVYLLKFCRLSCHITDFFCWKQVSVLLQLLFVVVSGDVRFSWIGFILFLRGSESFH